MSYKAPKKNESESRSVMSNSLQRHGLYPAKLLCPWNSPGQNTGVGSHSFLLGIFPTRGLNPCLPHGRWILYCLRHEGSPKRNEVSLIHQPKIRPNICILTFICIWMFLNQAQKVGIFKGCIIRFTQLG